MSEEEQGFVVRDKRGRSEPEPSNLPPPPPSEPEPAFQTDSSHPAPPLTFSSFVFSLGTSSLMLMGESINPEQPPPPMNLPQAKEIIDILSILEEKTRGNLTSDEEAVLRDMLYALRMKYVDAASGKPATTSS